MSEEKDDHGKSQAKAQLESIVEMVKALRAAREKDDQDAIEEAEQAILEDPLSVQVRDPWRDPGSDRSEISPEEFCILLATGGPAVRIIGELNRCAEPHSPVLEYQDWGTPWTEYPIETEDERDALLEYCRPFYFEG